MTGIRGRLARRLQARQLPGVTPGPCELRVRRGLRVPMDDGVELLADLYTPAGQVEPGLPTIVIRSPYGRSNSVTHAAALAREGFTVVVQSCRGTWGSGGTFTPQVHEQADGTATHRWVRAQPWFTGSVATYGQSYLGYCQWAVAGRMQREDPGRAPDALCLTNTMADFGAVTWDNGAFALGNALGWSQWMDLTARRGPAQLLRRMRRRPDRDLGRAFGVLPLGAGDTAAAGRPIGWYQDWLANEQLTAGYWTQQSHTASVPDVTAPVCMSTGWYDIFLPWQLRTYAQLVRAGRPPRLTVGPWGHIGGGEATSFTEAVDFLKEQFAGAASRRVAPVRAFLTGAGQWHDLPAWPPPGAARPWHLHASGLLDQAAPDGGVTRYTYDPGDPTPAVGGPGLTPDSAPADNRAHELRSDVAVFRSAPLEAAVVIAGEPVARVRFRSSAPSADVFVRICDVHPDGRSLTVCDGIRRIGGAGTAATGPRPGADGFAEVEVPLWPAFHEFAAGHRIGVQIGSGAHPRYARNPGTGEPAVSATATVRAEQEISHDTAGASRIDLPVWAPEAP
ncbi:CocE/NonD family hydrolase [Actinacidiphila bryophytorum]|uniref:PepX_C domain-containing protein n=1 Tax=Actinacidiphila bryophytorum TaxID=1436133 RepID=A0A9W4E0V8_9ACTN|nr:CocE/NonD family hydrolase [Actinacidiphila bryophytorum]MBM9440458.1 CocE/NonD family hydrolase [Actinacidiphila bryophytorum]MBN6542576.1 CocE/NonD family hydrolase [Actinacidiphila bryophytorum]CAG7612463.1 PepX_C domain-containing protein [Actinacidiphila bryophytorum]